MLSPWIPAYPHPTVSYQGFKDRAPRIGDVHLPESNVDRWIPQCNVLCCRHWCILLACGMLAQPVTSYVYSTPLVFPPTVSTNHKKIGSESNQTTHMLIPASLNARRNCPRWNIRLMDDTDASRENSIRHTLQKPPKVDDMYFSIFLTSN